MAKSQSNIVKSHFEFSVPLEHFVRFETPEIIVGEIPWIIRICRISKESPDGKRDWLNAYLDCNYKDTEKGKNTKWWIEAAATLELITFNENNDPVETIVSKKKFKEGYRTFELPDFLPWDDLFDEGKRYTEMGEIKIKGVIMTTPLCRQSGLELTKTHVGMLIQNVNSLTTTYSNKVILRGIGWRVKIQKETNSIGVYLLSEFDVEHFAWTYLVRFTVKLMSFCDDDEPLKKKKEHRFFYVSAGWGWKSFIAWDTFLEEKSKYVLNYGARFEFSIDVEPGEPVWKFENALIGNEIQSKCPICLDTFDDQEVMATTCGHLFCSDCIEESIEKHEKCPLCNATSTVAGLRVVYLHS